MIFYLNYASNEELFRDFNITFRKKLTKDEKLFFQYLLQHYSETKNVFLEIEKVKIKKLLKLSTDEDLVKCLNKFISLKINYSFKDFENNMFQGMFNVMDSYFIQKENVVIVLSREILLSFDKNNFFNKVNLKCILNFNHAMSLKIYLKLLGTRKDEGDIDFLMEELKEIFEIENSYERFYDFETKILIPIINDLNNFSEYEINYSKIKNGDFKSAKVIKIRINYTNKVIKRLKRETNELILLIKDLIINFNVVYEEILNSLKKYDYDYVSNNIKHAKKYYSGEFDTFLLKSLNENLYLKNLNNKKHISIKKRVKNSYELQEEVYKTLITLNLDHFVNEHFLSTSFSKKIYFLRDGETSFFENNVMRIEVLYKKHDESYIEIDILK